MFQPLYFLNYYLFPFIQGQKKKKNPNKYNKI